MPALTRRSLLLLALLVASGARAGNSGWFEKGQAAEEKLAATRIIGLLEPTRAQSLELTETLDRATEAISKAEAAANETLARYRPAGEAARKRALSGGIEPDLQEEPFAAAEKSAEQQRRHAHQEAVASVKAVLERSITPAQWSRIRELAGFPAPEHVEASGPSRSGSGRMATETRLLELTRRQSAEEWEKARRSMEKRIADPDLRPALRDRLAQRLDVLARVRQLSPEEYQSQRASLAAELTQQIREENRAEHPLVESDAALYLARQLLLPEARRLLRSRGGQTERKEPEHTRSEEDAAAASTAFAEARALRTINQLALTPDQLQPLVRSLETSSRTGAEWERSFAGEGREAAAALKAAIPAVTGNPRLKIAAEAQWMGLANARETQLTTSRSRARSEIAELLRTSLTTQQSARLLPLARDAAVRDRMEDPTPETRSAITDALHELEQLRNQPAAEYPAARERLAQRWAAAWSDSTADAVTRQRAFLDQVRAISTADWPAQQTRVAAQLARTRAAAWAAQAKPEQLLQLFVDHALLQPEVVSVLRERLSSH